MSSDWLKRDRAQSILEAQYFVFEMSRLPFPQENNLIFIGKKEFLTYVSVKEIISINNKTIQRNDLDGGKIVIVYINRFYDLSRVVNVHFC